MIKKSVLLLFCLFGIILFLSGCFGDSISIPVGEEGESISVGGNEEDGFTLETKNADGESVSLSSSKDLPDDFPEDIPFPEEYQIISTVKLNDAGEEGMNVSYMTETTFDEVWELYKNFMNDNGFESNTEMTSNEYSSLVMQKDNESVSVTVIAAEGESTVTVNLSYIKTASPE
ncbi:hypothetical protein NC661_19735 [Aquibacillus koreensis]|uniref:Uncharacterized protein n=1 Tax=Aquibacillus koreensis TaxID=279446 RepID=A0A9X4AK82_9BACI|nr:hypothetical protein [Aquibacillus koreensis]MCT2534197.1 hypothetical protein [Aquibacillus koreensis]MDC3422589.1 hypothetical protein [Aquibacillus koreensis]